MQMKLFLCPVLVYNFSKLAQLEQLNADVELANVQVCRVKLLKQNIVILQQNIEALLGGGWWLESSLTVVAYCCLWKLKSR